MVARQQIIYSRYKMVCMQVYAGDGLPAQVCKECINQVNTSYKFKLQCERANATLRQHLNNQQPHDPPVQVICVMFLGNNFLSIIFLYWCMDF
jgi:hypothetical protein